MAVDISSLEQFAAVIRQELDLNFIPHAMRVLDRLDPQVPFPAHEQFVEAATTGHRYWASCEEMAARLSQFAQTTRALADAAHTIAANYRGSDQLAAVTVQQAADLFAPHHVTGPSS